MINNNPDLNFVINDNKDQVESMVSRDQVGSSNEKARNLRIKEITRFLHGSNSQEDRSITWIENNLKSLNNRQLQRVNDILQGRSGTEKVVDFMKTVIENDHFPAEASKVLEFLDEVEQKEELSKEDRENIHQIKENMSPKYVSLRTLGKIEKMVHAKQFKEASDLINKRVSTREAVVSELFEEFSRIKNDLTEPEMKRKIEWIKNHIDEGNLSAKNLDSIRHEIKSTRTERAPSPAFNLSESEETHPEFIARIKKIQERDREEDERALSPVQSDDSTTESLPASTETSKEESPKPVEQDVGIGGFEARRRKLESLEESEKPRKGSRGHRARRKPKVVDETEKRNEIVRRAQATIAAGKQKKPL